MMAYQLPGVHEGMGTSRADGRLFQWQDVGLHGQGRHNAHRALAFQVSNAIGALPLYVC